MEAKFMLQLDQDVLEQAKRYAHDKQQSLSALIERYLRFLIVQEREPEIPEISPLVQQLSGILESVDEQQFREDYTDYLVRKYQS